MKLTPKQAAFIREYLVDLNATQAAIRAGYSKRTAYRTGADNLKNPQIAAAVATAQAERAKRTELTQDYVLAGLRGIADDDGQPAAPRVRALELLGKHQGMFVERVDHTTKGEAMPAAVQVYLPANHRDESEGVTE